MSELLSKDEQISLEASDDPRAVALLELLEPLPESHYERVLETAKRERKRRGVLRGAASILMASLGWIIVLGVGEHEPVSYTVKASAGWALERGDGLDREIDEGAPLYLRVRPARSTGTMGMKVYVACPAGWCSVNGALEASSSGALRFEGTLPYGVKPGAELRMVVGMPVALPETAPSWLDEAPPAGFQVLSATL